MRTVFITALGLLWAASLSAQIPVGGTPPSLDPSLSNYFTTALTTVDLPAFDERKALAEDARGPGIRFAAPVPVAFRLREHGQWTDLDNGDRVWRLQLRSAGAKALVIFYEDFYLPPGARLYVHTPSGRQVLGAYTDLHNPPAGRFMSGPVYGEEAVIEYLEPAAVRGQGRLAIHRVDHAYKEIARREVGAARNEFGYGASLDCHPNAACPLADPVAELRSSICRIIVVVEEGTGYCTGNLVNNTAEDGRPFIYTGFHCMDGYTPLYDLWRFDFNYRAADCAEPNAEPAYTPLMGSTYRAGRRDNDFLLLELTQAVPAHLQAAFLGWNREALGPDTTYVLHHPRGDIQKIARSTRPAFIYSRTITWNNELVDVTTPRNHHFDVDYTEGDFEVGSSGSAMLNPQGQLVGHLHGGNPGEMPCTNSQAFFGRFSLAWEGGGTPDTRLRDWLDPLGTDTMSMGSLAREATDMVSGKVQSWTGKPVAEVTVTLTAGDQTLTTTSDAGGNFSFTEINAADSYRLSFSLQTPANRMVTTADIIDIQRHILSLVDLGDPYRLIAADANASGNVSALDVIAMRRVILSIATEFGPGVPSWIFIPADHTFADLTDPWASPPPAELETTDLSVWKDLQIIAVKRGDVNDR